MSNTQKQGLYSLTHRLIGLEIPITNMRRCQISSVYNQYPYTRKTASFDIIEGQILARAKLIVA